MHGNHNIREINLSINTICVVLKFLSKTLNCLYFRSQKKVEMLRAVVCVCWRKSRKRSWVQEGKSCLRQCNEMCYTLTTWANSELFKIQNDRADKSLYSTRVLTCCWRIRTGRFWVLKGHQWPFTVAYITVVCLHTWLRLVIRDSLESNVFAQAADSAMVALFFVS